MNSSSKVLNLIKSLIRIPQRSYGTSRLSSYATMTLRPPLRQYRFFSSLDSNKAEMLAENQEIKEAETTDIKEAIFDETTMEDTDSKYAETKEPVEADVLIEESELYSPTNLKKHSFKAETKRLLEIVAKSLYSEKEVFVRELISNASDAIEKRRHFMLTNPEAASEAFEIRLSVDQAKGTFIIQDTGIGMTEEELNDHLGTIAKSGSLAFANENKDADKIIGQFGVGFYSALMVGDEIKVYTRSAKPESKGYVWRTDGSGEYELSEAENVAVGTKIVIHLKKDSLNFALKDHVKKIVNKYSHFVGYPILLNGHKINTFEPLWMKDKSSVTKEQVSEFYKYLFRDYQEPLFHLLYSTDSPINVRSLLFIPNLNNANDYDLYKTESQIQLYTRKVLVKTDSKEMLPEWMRFIRGVADSEDIPLNLSREMLQNNGAILKLKTILANRILKWLKDISGTDEYKSLYKKISIFFKEGILQDQQHKNQIMDLIMFETTKGQEGDLISLATYVERMPEDQKEIYYFVGTDYKSAMASPYLEPFIQKGYDVLLTFSELDHVFASSLLNYKDKKIVSAIIAGKTLDVEQAKSESALTEDQSKELSDFLKGLFKDKVNAVTVGKRFTSHPLMISDPNDFLRVYGARLGMKMTDVPVEVEININHNIIQKLYSLMKEDAAQAENIAYHLFDLAKLVSGINENTQVIASRAFNILEAHLNNKK